MDLDEQIEIEHLLFSQRVCRTCNVQKDLIDDFYVIRKNKNSLASSYSYECKECTIKRVSSNRVSKKTISKWEYPDW